MADTVEKCSGEDSPDRCQGMSKIGQCYNKKLAGADFCIMHGGGSQQRSNEAKSISGYKLAVHQSRMMEFGTNPEVKDLRGEIAIARLTLESVLVRCTDNYTLVLESPRISSLVSQIERLVTAAAKLDTHANTTMSKSQLIEFASKIVTIISKELSGEPLERISNAILGEIKNGP